MRPIHLAELDKARPVLVLTREMVRPHLATVTIAPITTTIRGLSTEVHVGGANGLATASVVSCDNITTVPADALGAQIGLLFDRQEPDLSAAIQAAFDLSSCGARRSPWRRGDEQPERSAALALGGEQLVAPRTGQHTG